VALLFSAIDLTLYRIQRLKKNLTILRIIILLLPETVISQTHISIATDISIIRSFKQDQRFWAFGQNVVMNWHFTQSNGAYASVSYFSNGNFKNNLLANAKSGTTIPQQIFFVNRAQVRLEQISLGWRYYWLGTNDAETEWSIYSTTGFGLIFGKATNRYSTFIDTSLFDAPPRPINGSGHFKRLTLDLGLGLEIPLGGDLHFYTEARVWIPASDYPSKYLFVNDNAPFTGMVTAGIRIPLN